MFHSCLHKKMIHKRMNTFVLLIFCLLQNGIFANYLSLSVKDDSNSSVNEILTEIMDIRFDLNSLAPNIDFTFLQSSLTVLIQIITQNLTQNSLILELSRNTLTTITESVLHTIDIVISKNDWTVYPEFELSQTTTQILQIYQEYSFFLNKHLKYFNETQLTIYLPSVWLSTKVFQPAIDLLIVFQFQDIKLQLPTQCIARNWENISVTAIVTHSLAENSSFNQTTINSAIISITIEDYPYISLNSTKCTFQYRVNHLVPLTKRGGVSKCAFWDLSYSNWSTVGCKFDSESSNTHFSTCQCSHLSDFVLLHSPENPIEVTTTPIVTISINQTVETTATSIRETTATPIKETTATPIKETTATPIRETTTQQIEEIDPTEEISNQIDNLLNSILTLPEFTEEIWFVSLRNISNLVSAILDNDDLLSQVNSSLATQLTNSSLIILNCLIEQENVWSNLTQNHTFYSSSTIFKTVADLSRLMNIKLNESEILFTFNHIQLHSKTFSTQSNNKIYFEFDEITLQLPFDAINLTTSQLEKWKNISATATILKRFPEYLSFDQLFVNSHVISIQLGDYTGTVSLNEFHKLKFTSQNLNRLEFGDKPHCVFWSFSRTNISTSGCTYNRSQSNRSHTVCDCDHLTDFLTLTDIGNREVPTLAKSILTFICSSISCFFLICTVYMALKYNRDTFTMQEDQFKVKSNRYQISLSISIWLLISHMLIMFGLDRTEVQVVCDLTSVVLLYSLLTTFAFMLMFSAHLYLATTDRHLFAFFPFKYFAIFAYLFPLTIIALSFIIIYVSETHSFMGMLNSLAGEYFCWLSSTKYPTHIWIFVAPVTLIIVANACVLTSLFYTILRNRRLQQTSQSKRQYGNLITAYILVFNFGLPWILYLLYINEYMAHIFSYVFILVNGTQGTALFAEQYIQYRNKLKRSFLRKISDSSKSTILSLKK